MSTVDRRTVRTRRALRSALISLLQTRDYDDVSVNDLLEVADVGRSTFYAHFTGKDDLLRQSLKALGQEIREEVARRPEDGPAGRLGFSWPLLEHLESHRALHRRLKGRGGELFPQILGQLVGDLVREGLGPGASELEVQYVRGAFLGLVTWWLEHSTAHSVADVDAVFQRLTERCREAA